ncbi:hypothetical protein [Pacificibacter sp. AS14]|uniref:hypothetical protein n=1 Tax=Pacificibacter sp. AS14 TaxID=3135785 RepID=UPI00317BF502
MKSFSIAILFALLASAASADIYADCMSAIKTGNLSEAKRLGKMMQGFSTISARKWEDASACVSSAEGQVVIYDAGRGNFLPADELQKLSEERKQKREEQIVRDEARRAEIRAQQREQELAKIEVQARIDKNNALIARDIYAACTALFNDEKIAAMTNEICVASFRQNGHPDLSLP